MAKIKLEIVFENKEWREIKHEGSTSDKNAYRIYRLIIPKKDDLPEPEKTKA